MTHTYNISGMTCNGCVAKTKSELLKLRDITEADVQLVSPQATITMQKHIPVNVLQNTLSKAGNYVITEAENGMHHSRLTQTVNEEPASWLKTYKPILLIGIYITGITLLYEVVYSSSNWHNWMQNFMGAFFIVFSFFKLLDLSGFADSYSTYDVIAKKWHGWGYLYPFIELALGIAFLIRFNPLITNGVTFVVMSISIIGVLQSVLNKRKIRCACLGAVFNIPMSTVTIIEDALMIIMSAVMIITLM